MRRKPDKPLGNCPNCRGSGWVVRESWSIKLMTRQPIRDVKVKCKQCAGTGNVDGPQLAR